MSDDIIYNVQDKYKYSTCSMICRLDLYVMHVTCGCRIEIDVGGNIKLEYFDIEIRCLVESFTHPIEWSDVGDYKYRDDVLAKEEWYEIKTCITNRIHEGYYNYELGYKAFNLID